jgi:hypothetical protein
MCVTHIPKRALCKIFPCLTVYTILMYFVLNVMFCCAGTVNHRSRSYWDDKQLAVFNVLIIVTDDRVTALDVELLHIATRVYGKPVAILKNKGDAHLDNMIHDAGEDEAGELLTTESASVRLVEGFQANIRGASPLCYGMTDHSFVVHD